MCTFDERVQRALENQEKLLQRKLTNKEKTELYYVIQEALFLEFGTKIIVEKYFTYFIAKEEYGCHGH